MPLLHSLPAALKGHAPDGTDAGLFTRAFECVGAAGPVSFCAKVMRADSKLAYAMPVEGEEWKKEFREGVELCLSAVPVVNGALGMEVPGGLDLGFVWMRALARGLDVGG